MRPDENINGWNQSDTVSTMIVSVNKYNNATVECGYYSASIWSRRTCISCAKMR